MAVNMKKKKKPDFSKPKKLDTTQEIQQINNQETDYSDFQEAKPVHEKLKDGISTKHFCQIHCAFETQINQSKDSLALGAGMGDTMVSYSWL